MPGNETEIPVLVRRFNGVDVQTDPAFLPEDVLQASQNLVPQLTYLLQKRFGSTLVPNLTLASVDGLPFASPRIDLIQFVIRADGTPLLFFIVTTIGNSTTTARGDRLFVSVGTPPAPPIELFNFDRGTGAGVPIAPAGWVSTSGARYGAAVLGGNLYVGNGINPILVVALDTLTVNPLVPLGTFTMAGVAALATSSTNQGLDPGTYSYRWAYLDASGTVAFWRSVSGTRIVVVTGTAPQALTFTGPSNAEIAAATNPALPPLDANHTAHLFLSPPGLPIEYARDHGFVSSGGPATLTVSIFNLQGQLTPLRGATFTGRFLTRHTSRIWLSGDQTNGGKNTSRLYSTNTIIPGLEQTLYNQGDFFPALANTQVGGFDGDPTTGLAVSGGGAHKDVQTSPMLVFKRQSIYSWFGDLVDDPNAALIQVSDWFGCAAPQTIVSTTEGVFFLGLDSVYYFAPGFIDAVDIGLPIRPAIQNIPNGRLPFATAIFHRGFYKLAITPPGGAQNTIQWWLDLRPAIESGADVKSTAHWWGPHVCTPTSTFEVGVLDPAEHDRLYFGRECDPTEHPPVVTICLGDETNVYTDVGPITTLANSAVWDVSHWDAKLWGGMLFSANPVVARLRTGGLVEDDPFGWKDWTLTRIVSKPDTDTPVTVTAYLDGNAGVSQPIMNQNKELDGGLPPNLILAQSGAAIWDRSRWDQSTWGQRLFVEGWAIFEPALRAHSLEIELVHNNASGLQIRDLEARYAPIARRAPGAR